MLDYLISFLYCKWVHILGGFVYMKVSVDSKSQLHEESADLGTLKVPDCNVI
jgi:hypothetical protein